MLEAQAEEQQRLEAAAMAAAAQEAERQRLQRLSTRFALRLEGSVSIVKPPEVRDSHTVEENASSNRV